jgi:hypothetical protein
METSLKNSIAKNNYSFEMKVIFAAVALVLLVAFFNGAQSGFYTTINYLHWENLEGLGPLVWP